MVLQSDFIMFLFLPTYTHSIWEQLGDSVSSPRTPSFMHMPHSWKRCWDWIWLRDANLSYSAKNCHSESTDKVKDGASTVMSPTGLRSSVLKPWDHCFHRRRLTLNLHAQWRIAFHSLQVILLTLRMTKTHKIGLMFFWYDLKWSTKLINSLGKCLQRTSISAFIWCTGIALLSPLVTIKKNAGFG